MSRTARRIAPLLQSLVVGAATASAVALGAGSIAGCGDENDPATHVKKLSDPATRQQAVGRLIQFFEDAMTRDKDDRNGPTVKPLLDTIVQPLNETCLNGDLDERTNAKLVKFMSYARDARGGDCILKALKDFKPERKETEEPVRWAARAIGPMKLKTASGPLLDVFIALHPSKLKAEPELYRDVHDAMMDIVDPAWEPKLIERLGHPINDRKDVATLRDEVYWQTTSAELLGVLKSAGAVKPLIKTVLSPNKADVAATSVNALIKIGKASVAPTVALLRSEDKELVEYSKGENLKANAGPDGKVPDAAAKAAEKAHIATAAIILSSIGRDEATSTMLDAIDKTDKGDDLTRAVLARELPKLPKTDQTMKVFQSVYEKTPNGLDIPPGNGAKESLLESSGYFFDASIVPWIVKTAVDLKGEADDIDPIRAASLTAAMKLMKADQTGDVEKLFSIKANGPDGKPTTLGKAYEKEYKLTTDILKACGDKVDCYLQKAADPASQANETQFQGIKAVYMVGILGGPEVRQKLIDTMPKFSNAALRFIAVTIIDHDSPKGDAGLATSLQKMVDEADASKDPLKIQGNAPFKQVIYRLNARGQ